MKHDLEGLQDVSKKFKPSGADQEWTDLAAFYWDQARAQTAGDLKQLGTGLKHNSFPLDLAPLLRQVVDRSATIYRQPPARFLVDVDGQRLDEDDDEHQLMVKVLERASYDVVWRRVDRLRTLLGQVALRFYPSDKRSAVVLRTFEPQSILREPDLACGDLMDHDRRFALKLEGDRWELWYRHPDGSGRWCMVWVAADGTALPRDDQPFGESAEVVNEAEHYVSPYNALPVQMVYVDHPAGASWLPPRQSRRAWIRGLNSCANDAQALITLQAHVTRVYKRKDPNNRLPESTGPNMVWNIENDEEVVDLKPMPAIDQAIELIRTFSRLFAQGEYLPGSEFDPQKQVLTGAARRVELQPLYDRREDQVPLVQPDERDAYRRLRAVHNHHHGAWGARALSADFDLELEVPDLEAPTTPTEAGNLASRQLALGTASVIDLIMRETSCTRPEAIRRYERVKRDFELYPPLTREEVIAERVIAETNQGPRPTSAPEPGPTAPDNQPDEVLDGRASVVDAVRRTG